MSFVALYDAAVTTYDRGLAGLSAVLRKSADSGKDEQMLLDARLAPDMYSLARQVRIACDFAHKTPARVLGMSFPPEQEGEAGFATLQRLIASTREFLDGLKPAQFEGLDEKPVSFPVGDRELTMPAFRFVTGFSTPNFYFHCVTAYGILRHQGVALGKLDYFGTSA